MREVGGRRDPRQPGQVRKEAAVTRFFLGCLTSLSPFYLSQPLDVFTDLLDMNETVEKSIYQVLARKYRPSTFSELVGQDRLLFSNEAMSSIRNVVPNGEKQRMYRGRGGEILRLAAMRLLKAICRNRKFVRVG